jgi:hypothetical protein
MFGSSLPPAACRNFLVLITVYMFASTQWVQHILCCIFALFFFVLDPTCCRFQNTDHWTLSDNMSFILMLKYLLNKTNNVDWDSFFHQTIYITCIKSSVSINRCMNIIEFMCCNEVEPVYVRVVLVSRNSQILKFNGINQSYEH